MKEQSIFPMAVILLILLTISIDGVLMLFGTKLMLVELLFPFSCSLLVDFDIHVWDIRRPYIPYASFSEHKDVVTGNAQKRLCLFALNNFLPSLNLLDLNRCIFLYCKTIITRVSHVD